MKNIFKDKFIDGFVWVCFILCLGFVLGFPDESAASVIEGGELFLNSILPTLFPFFVISSFATNSGIDKYLGKIFGNFHERFFGIKSGEYTYTISVLSGYPASARIVSEGYSQGAISMRDAQVLLILCSNCSAAFILSFVGASVLKSMSAAYILLFANYISTILAAKILAEKLHPVNAFVAKGREEHKQSYISSFISAVMSSIGSVINVGAFIIFFSVIRACAQTLAGSSQMIRLLTSVVELSAGCKIVSECLFTPPAIIGITGFLIGFGGICVIFQSLSFIEGTNLSKTLFVKYKLLCGVINGIISFLLASFISTGDIGVFYQETIPMNVTQNDINILLLGILFFIILLSLVSKDSEKNT